MSTKVKSFLQSFLKKDLADIRPGDTVRVYQKIKEAPKKSKSSKAEGPRERIQVFEGVVIAKKHGKGITSTFTVRKVVSGIGVERTFPFHSPNIEKIEIVRRAKVRRAKLYFLREVKGKKARLKKKEFKEAVAKQEPKEAIEEKPIKEEIEKEKVEGKENE